MDRQSPRVTASQAGVAQDVMGLDARTLHHLWECSEVHQLLQLHVMGFH